MPTTVRTSHRGQLSPELLAAFRASLEEQRRFREDQLRHLGAPGAPGAPGPAGAPEDEAETARAEVRSTLVTSARMVLTDVEAALRRLDEGRYGTCRLCHRTIATERLHIVPQARYCLPCHQVRRLDGHVSPHST